MSIPQEAKQKIDGFRRFIHDERSEKERALREQQEASGR
jgi:hypothetical protein